ncbi:MAG: hypothetical protein UHS41_01585 [Lachnospiraceae bacterium]|nr:hypothetical protein [Lachnospiraceae bacterium]
MKKIVKKDGSLIQIITEAVYENKKLVVYQELKEPFEVYAMEEEKFKLWMEGQEEKTVLVEIKETNAFSFNEEPPVERKRQIVQPVMERFLDAKTYNEKIGILESAEEFMDANVLDLMAASLDLIVEGDSIDEKYYSLMQILKTQARFETNR